MFIIMRRCVAYKTQVCPSVHSSVSSICSSIHPAFMFFHVLAITSLFLDGFQNPMALIFTIIRHCVTHKTQIRPSIRSSACPTFVFFHVSAVSSLFLHGFQNVLALLFTMRQRVMHKTQVCPSIHLSIHLSVLLPCLLCPT